MISLSTKIANCCCNFFKNVKKYLKNVYMGHPSDKAEKMRAIFEYGKRIRAGKFAQGIKNETMKASYFSWLLLLNCLLNTGCRSDVKEPAIIPAPASIEMGRGCFTFGPNTIISVEDKAQKEVAEWFSWLFARSAGFVPKVVENPYYADVMLCCDDSLEEEAYEIKVTPGAVRISASSAPGFFYAFQTLRMALPSSIDACTHSDRTEWTVPSMTISDAPRFRHRCIKLNMSEISFNIAALLNFVDCLAMLKFNHIHLSEDMGRYSEDDLLYLMDYASQLNIHVIQDEGGATESELMPDMKNHKADVPAETAPKDTHWLQSMIGMDNVSLRDIYNYEPILVGDSDDSGCLLLGVQAADWISACNGVDDMISRLYPRLGALAEVAWTREDGKDWGRFLEAVGIFGAHVDRHVYSATLLCDQIPEYCKYSIKVN